jgi:hypothetical protein
MKMLRVFPRVDLGFGFKLKDAYKAIKCLEESMANIPDEVRSTYGGYSFVFTKWTPAETNTEANAEDKAYYALQGIIDLKEMNMTIRVIDGYMEAGGPNEPSQIVEGDGFIDIKSDETSIEQAIADIVKGAIPLHNRVEHIDFSNYPYILIETDSD